MSTVLDDVTDERIDSGHIQRRVEDWEERLRALYTMIRDWLPEGWTARNGTPVRMHEAMMRQVGIPPKRLPTLQLVDRAGGVAKFEPRALWIIGCNGRVDLKQANYHFLIVDLAENFEPPDWRAARADRRRDRVSVTRDWLRSVLQ